MHLSVSFFLSFFTILSFVDPFRDLMSVMAEDEQTRAEKSSTTTRIPPMEVADTSDTSEETTTSSSTTSSSTTTPALPKSCPAPDVTYNGSLLSTVEAFKDIHDVEFEVRTGPFPKDNQRCKLTCVDGQWVGPLCKNKESKCFSHILD